MAELQPGDIFAGHRIEGVAGRGGFGVVYRATHLALDHIVAIKVITTGRTEDETFRDRFKSESRIAVSIRHPNVVAVHNAGEEDGMLFVTMDFIEGTDLRGLLNREGRIPPERAIPIISQVAAALDAAHERGLVHRDIKPGNVLLEDRKGTEHVYLTDFGLSKQMDATSGVTASGAFVGTLDYVAPEQIKGSRLDARTDVYALGCVLFELLSGQVPFSSQEDKVAKIYAHLQEDPPELRDVAPEISPAISDVVWRSMQKDPEKRQPSAGDLARAAKAAVEGRQPSEPERNVGIGAAAPTELFDALGSPETASAAGPAPTMTSQSPTPAETPSATPATPEETVAVPPPAAGAGAAAASEAGDATQAVPPPQAKTGAAQPPPPPRDYADAPTAAEAQPKRTISGKTVLLVLVVLAVIAGGAYALTSGGGNETGSGGKGGDNGGGGGGGGLTAEVINDNLPSVPVGVAVAGGDVWVSSRDGQAVSILDPNGDPKQDPIKVGGQPEQIAIDGDGTAWVAVGAADETSPGTVQQIAPDGTVQNTFGVGVEPRGIALGNEAAWVANIDSDSVSKIPLAGGTIETFPGDAPARVAEGENAIWVTNSGNGTVTKFTGGGTGTQTIKAGTEPRGIVVAEGSVFVSDAQTNNILAIDPQTNKVSTIAQVDGEPRTLDSGFGSLWVTTKNNLSRVDPKTGDVTVVDRVDSPDGLAVDENGGAVYTSSGDEKSPGSLEVTKP